MENKKRKINILIYVFCFLIFISVSGRVKAATDTKNPDLIYGTNGSITRAEWLHDLTILFEMTVEEDNMPDDYFSDVTSEHPYYRDLLVATEFGVIDVEAGGEVLPDQKVDREFAVHTLNYCLGFELGEDESYTFKDIESVQYPIDAQVAINRGWVTLIDGNFSPRDLISEQEIKIMFDDVEKIRITTEIQPGYDNQYKFTGDVIEIPDGTEVSIGENNEIIIFNSPKEIKTGDSFAVYFHHIPQVYTATSVENRDNSLVIKARPVDINEVMEEVDAQGQVEGDLALAEPLGNTRITYIAGGTEARNYEDGTEYRNPRMAGSKPIKAINAEQEIPLEDGSTLTLTCKMYGLAVDYKLNLTEVYVSVHGTAELSGNAKLRPAGEISNPKTIELMEIPVAYVGAVKVTAEYAVTGDITLVYSTDFNAGIQYTLTDGFRTVKNFHKKSFSICAEVEVLTGVKVALGIYDLPIINGEIYARMGMQMQLKSNTFNDGKMPNTCMHTQAWLYADMGANGNLDLGIKSFAFSEKSDIFNKSNSPVRVAYHYEDGKLVAQCTRGLTYDGHFYISKGTKYGNTNSGYVIDEEGNVVPVYTYNIENGQAVITGYTGKTAALYIPAELDGYTVTAIGEGAFQDRSDLVTVAIPDTIKEIRPYAFSDCSSLTNVTLPAKLEVLGDRAFERCVSLFSIWIPKSLGIGKNSRGPFDGCSGLEHIVFEEGITRIPNALFSGCSGMRRIEIPETVTIIADNAFKNCTRLTDINIPSHVTEINVGAFSGCTSLRSVVIPNGVTKIEGEAFADCSSLTDITLPSTLQRLGVRAFLNCTSLPRIWIPKSLTDVPVYRYTGQFSGCSNLRDVEFEAGRDTIPGNLFAGCDGLEELVIPDGITTIGNAAFHNCSNLRKVSFPNSLIDIRDEAFLNCNMLAEIEIPDSVKTIGAAVFRECDELQRVTMGDGVTKIGKEAFYGCSMLADVKLSSNLEEMEWEVFGDCVSLTSIFIPKSLNTCVEYPFSLGPFARCYNLTEITFEKGIKKIPDNLFCGCDGLKRVDIPDTVTEIGSGAFSECKNLLRIEIPQSVILISRDAFLNCNNLAFVTFGEGVTEIGAGAFRGCIALKEVILPKGLVKMEYEAFRDCYSLNHVWIPKSLKESQIFADSGAVFAFCSQLTNIEFEEGRKEIPDNLFVNCTGLQEITLPDSIEKIGRSAFRGCNNLKSVTFPNGLIEIDESAFYKCESLTEVMLGDMVSKIGKSAFAGCVSLSKVQLSSELDRINEFLFNDCTKLSSIVFPEGIVSIGESAFEGTGLQTVDLPETLVEIGKNAFKDNNSLKSIAFKEKIQIIGEAAFSGCDMLTEINLPDSLKQIGRSAFADCGMLEKIRLSNGLTEIPAYAFDLCGSLKEITLPYRIASIGDRAFTNCVKLTGITIPRATKTIADQVFSYPSKMTIYGVPGTYAETYANNKGIKFVGQETKATQVTLSAEELEMNKGQTSTLVLTVEPENFTDQVIWKSSNTAVATIDENGLVTAKEIGTATIKVNVGDVSAACKINVVQPVTEIKLNPSSLIMEAMTTEKLTAEVYPDTASDKGLLWSSSNESVATVTDAGVVEAVGKGTAMITAAAADGSGVTGQCEVTVTNNGYRVTEVSQLESPHPYTDNCSDFWIYTMEGADELTLTFDPQTNIEQDFDYLYLYDAKDTEIGKFTGTEWVETPVKIAGDTVKIRLVSDAGGHEWGFKVSSISSGGVVEKGEQRLEGTSSYRKAYGDEPFSLDVKVTAGNGALSYHSANPEIAEVTEAGLVTIKGVGETMITVTAAETEEYKESSMDIRLVVEKAVQEVTVELSPNVLKIGETAQISATASTGMFTYQSSDSSIAEVNEEGIVTAIAAGKTTIQINALENEFYQAASAEIEITVLEEGTEISLEQCELILDPMEFVYDGTPKEPQVILRNGSEQLTETVHYTVSYENNIDPGTAMVTVTAVEGSGYTGSKTGSFTILEAPEEVALEECTVTLEYEEVVYDGTEKQPKVNVQYGEQILEEGVHYSVAYTDNVNPGIAFATVTALEGSGYTGTVTRSFTILESAQEATDLAECEVQLDTTEYTADGTEKRPAVTVTDGEIKLEEGVHYTVAYLNNVEPGTASVIVTAVEESGYTGSVTVEFTITEPETEKIPLSQCSIALDVSKYIYDGNAKQPKPTVTYGSLTLKEGTDYTVSYKDNVNPGTATVIVTAIEGSAYEGAASVDFVIEKAAETEEPETEPPTTEEPSTEPPSTEPPATEPPETPETPKPEEPTTEAPAEDIPLLSCKAVLEATQFIYDGKSKQPSVSVTYGAAALIQGKHYTVAYSNHVNPGTATATVTAIAGSGYTGTIKLSFTIQKKAEEKPKARPVGTNLKVNGNTYKVTSVKGGKAYVSLNKFANKRATTARTPSTIKVKGVSYRVTAVGTKAFMNCKRLKRVVIGSSVTKIGTYAFRGCTKLTSVTIPSYVTEIGSGAFYKCTALKKVTIGKAVKKIGSKAFYGCKNLRTLSIKGTKLKSVGRSAISNIHKKAVISVPRSKFKTYKKLFKKSTGFKTTMKIKR